MELNTKKEGSNAVNASRMLHIPRDDVEGGTSPKGAASWDIALLLRKYEEEVRSCAYLSLLTMKR